MSIFHQQACGMLRGISYRKEVTTTTKMMVTSISNCCTTQHKYKQFEIDSGNSQSNLDHLCPTDDRHKTDPTF